MCLISYPPPLWQPDTKNSPTDDQHSQYMLSYLRRLLPLLTIVPVSTMATPWPLLLFICIVSTDQKVWQWSNDFDNPSHWMEGRSPCPGQDVKIPAEIVFMPRVRVLGQLNLAVG